MESFARREDIERVRETYKNILLELERKDSSISDEEFVNKYRQARASIVEQDRFVLELDDFQVGSAVMVCRNIISLLSEMSQEVSHYQFVCKYNIHYLGSGFLDAISPKVNVQFYDLMDSLLTIYRFSNELVVMSRSSVRTGGFFNATNFLDDFFISSSQDLRELKNQYLYIKDVMVFKYLNFQYEKIDFEELAKVKFERVLEIDFDLLKDLDVKKINQHMEKGDLLFGSKEKAEKIIDERLGVLAAHEEKIKNYTTAYNFVGLSDGFKNMESAKDGQLKAAKYNMAAYGFMLITIPLTLIGLSLFKTTIDINNWGLIFPFLSLEIIVLYFYRVKLLEVRSLSAQILQINYRLSLCQFIQSYVEYSQDINEKSPGLLKNFESVIFSPIVANENEIPSTFDGVNQIADLFGKIKK